MICDAMREMIIHLFDGVLRVVNNKHLAAAAACLFGVAVVGFLWNRWARRGPGGGLGADPGVHVGGGEGGGGGEEYHDDGEQYHLIRFESLGNDNLPAPVTIKVTEGGANARIKYAASSMQGWGHRMEDTRALVPDLDDVTSFFGVYDGHGGSGISEYCAGRFHIELLNDEDYQQDLSSAIHSVFLRIDELLQESDEMMQLINPHDNWPFIKAPCNVAKQISGSTACVAVIRGNHIIVGNVGDSRCVISRNGQAIELSTEHILQNQVERLRIQRAGGEVIRDKFLVLAEGRTVGHWLGIHRINGILSLSRSIGDFAFKQNKNLPPSEQMVTCIPDLHIMEITNDMEFCVIGSHGLWDCMTSQDVVDFVNHHLRLGQTNVRVICERLVGRCLDSMDNVTAILVQFKNEVENPNGNNAGQLLPLPVEDEGVDVREDQAFPVEMEEV